MNDLTPSSPAGQQVADSQVARHLFQIQEVTGNVTVNSASVVRSRYLEHVREIAPLELLDRDEELAELAAFCQEPDRGPYVWWRAAAWTGKSALMASFVLRPPPGVHVVPFFVTARYAGQDDRLAFTEVVLEQLAEGLRQPMPAFLTPATREAHLKGMLAEMAGKCQSQGERLVLLVDGLDEDRGVTTSPDAYSIAALLPARPVSGLRVIVAGRPDPPIPEDVPDDHPLRDPGIVRVLGRSRWAEAAGADMRRELNRLTRGNRAERDLLGLVTASGGGLSGTDLAELTGGRFVEIEESLRTVAGRTFTTRASRYQPGTAPPVYVLGHEELQIASAASLGEDRLAGYRQQLHSWADSYRDRGWPEGTPEYLLRGYYSLLHAAADIPRIIACAIDEARHQRMLGVTGADTAALAEITQAQDVLFRLPEPELLTMARLAVRRTSITERNASIPATLPALWASLGQPARAEALALAIPGHDRRAQALAALVGAVAARGDLERAESLAEAIEVPRLQEDALIVLAVAAARAGDHQRARRIAAAVPARRRPRLAQAVPSPAGEADTAGTAAPAELVPGGMSVAVQSAKELTASTAAAVAVWET